MPLPWIQIKIERLGLGIRIRRLGLRAGGPEFGKEAGLRKGIYTRKEGGGV
jgi:hypothetical protein